MGVMIFCIAIVCVSAYITWAKDWKDGVNVK